MEEGSGQGAWRRVGRRYWLGFVIYAVCTCAVFWPAPLHLLTAFPQDLGDPPSQAWIIGWYTHTLLTNPTHLWDANIFYPTPGVFAYQDSLLGYAPVAMPLLLATGNLLLTYNLLFLLSFTLCGWFAFLLARYLLHLAGAPYRFIAPAALVAGLIYAYLPYKMSHLGHLNLLSAQWLPLLLLCWERAWRRGGAVAWAGVGLCFVAQALCSLYYAIFGGLAVLFLLAPRLRHRARPLPWWPLLLTAVLSGVALLPVLLPYIGTVRALGRTRGLAQTVTFSPALRDLLHTSPLSLLYGWTDRLFPPRAAASPQYLFPGLVPLALAIVGARTRPRSMPWPLRPYMGLGIVALALAFGPLPRLGAGGPALPGPYLILYWLVPGFQGLRDPGRMAVVAGLCLALLAAQGTVAVLGSLDGALKRPWRWPLAWAGVCGLVLLEYGHGPPPLPAVAAGAPPVYRWLAQQARPSPVLELPMGNRTAQVWSQQCLMMYYSTYHWQPIVNGAGGFFPPWYDRLQPLLQSFPSSASLGVLRGWGVRYVVVHGGWTGEATAARIARAAVAAHLRQAGHWGDDTAYAL